MFKIRRAITFAGVGYEDTEEIGDYVGGKPNEPPSILGKVILPMEVRQCLATGIEQIDIIGEKEIWAPHFEGDLEKSVNLVDHHGSLGSKTHVIKELTEENPDEPVIIMLADVFKTLPDHRTVLDEFGKYPSVHGFAATTSKQSLREAGLKKRGYRVRTGLLRSARYVFPQSWIIRPRHFRADYAEIVTDIFYSGRGDGINREKMYDAVPRLSQDGQGKKDPRARERRASFYRSVGLSIGLFAWPNKGLGIGCNLSTIEYIVGLTFTEDIGDHGIKIVRVHAPTNCTDIDVPKEQLPSARYLLSREDFLVPENRMILAEAMAKWPEATLTDRKLAERILETGPRSH